MAEELAADAAAGFAAGERVFYLKVGRGEALDLEITQAVRQEIRGSRLRLDANEAWSVAEAITMCRKLERFDIEFIEQPTVSWSIAAMAQLRHSVGIPIVADQAAFTLYDVYDIRRQQAADMICIGPREIGGIQPMMKAAAVAEAAGLKIASRFLLHHRHHHRGRAPHRAVDPQSRRRQSDHVAAVERGHRRRAAPFAASRMAGGAAGTRPRHQP